MKKTLLSMLLITAFGIFAFGQTIFADFDLINMTFGGWDGAAFSVVDNPKVDDNNGSDKVAQAATANTDWAGLYQSSVLGGDIDYSTSTTFSMKVYADTAGSVLMKLENNADNTDFQEITLAYTTPGEWQVLTYDMTTLAASVGTYNKFVLLFDPGVTEPGHVWFFDDITGPGFIPGADVEVTVEVTDLDDASTSVEVEFSSDAGTKIALTNAAGVWTTVQTIPGNTYLTSYTYTIYVDGTAVGDFTDKDLGIGAGSGTGTLAYTFGGGLTTEAVATYMEYDFPAIDGEIDDSWDAATQYDISLPFGASVFTDAADHNGYFKVGWDAGGIYVLIVTNDDYFNPYLGSGNEWEYDKVEAYFDMNTDNLKDGGGASGGNGHYQVAPFSWSTWGNEPDWCVGCERGYVNTVAGGTDTAVVADAYSSVTELFITWASLAASDGSFITKEYGDITYVPNGTIIGFDITLIDTDETDKNRLVWTNASDPESWANMDGCGTIELLGGPNVAVENNSYKRFNVYPNPAKDVLHISNSSEFTSVTIRNILGAEIMHVLTNGSDNFSVNTSSLNTGIYIISIENERGILSNNKFVVK